MTPSKASSISKSGTVFAVRPREDVPQQANLADFFADSVSMASSSRMPAKNGSSAAEIEKRRQQALYVRSSAGTTRAERLQDCTPIVARPKPSVPSGTTKDGKKEPEPAAKADEAPAPAVV